MIALTPLLHCDCSHAGPAGASGEAAAVAMPADVIYGDPTAPIDARIDDLISRMTLDEKISQLLSDNPAIERLGIPPYHWWNECAHGVAAAGRATVFPQTLALAATFDEDLIFRIADAIADEGRAKYNIAQHISPGRWFFGLTFWAPNINIFRDPRWGRGQETFGEDPVLTATLGSAFVRGLQGPDREHLKVAACAKHFAVHSGPEKLRHEFNAVVNAKDFNETYLPAFKALVDAGVEGVMGAYNRTNGEPCCASPTLLKEILREQWKFDGYIVSDCAAVNDFHGGHKLTDSPAESAALAVNNGINVECGRVFSHLQEAVSQGLVTEQTINDALRPALRTKLRLGMFDPPETSLYAALGDDVVGCESHRYLALEAARKAIVLLKNGRPTLPLSKNLRNIAVFGPNATSFDSLLGNYNGLPGSAVTPLEGIVAKVSPGCAVQYQRGCDLNSDNTAMPAPVLLDARRADAIIAVMGMDPSFEGEEGTTLNVDEGGDRLNLGLPISQMAFLRNLRQDCKDKPLIVVLIGGGPIVEPELHGLADALLFVTYPGEQGGAAIADVLFGDVSPSGRLNMTFPKSVEQLPPFGDYSMKGRTYRYMTSEPLYPFGFGLSYTTFEYQELTLTKSTIARDESVRASVRVTNTGTRSADEVVQLYISAQTTLPDQPIASLKAFRRISLAPGENTIIEFEITPDMLALVDEHGLRAEVPGQYTLTIGGSSPNRCSQQLGASRPVSVSLTISQDRHHSQNNHVSDQ